MNRDNIDKDDSVKHSQPIPMATHHWRHRSMSVSSESSTLPGSPPQVQTPLSLNSPRVPVASPSSSPILSFLSQSPTSKSPSSVPYRGFGGQPSYDEDALDELPATVHSRRAGTTGRFAPIPPAPEAQHDRGAGLLRRLSLGSALAKPPNVDNTRSRSPPSPTAPPNSAVSPTLTTLPAFTTRKARRSATVSIDTGRPRRAPSPMGERILKGHFDGFN
ncbi:hypothetical protein DFJ58DRAFT_665152 [Suillus subalutaceus]|uniref:uncharacterized protein n=1 Tax=Suillus subalutaceus TaxID=48586 RepID=UPI001B86CAEF|nr:uncharacterized protein DFJ58DRAFT_665152 [Suillus subalutaceus]KAG1843797.1 hypothetical protein DFJ58DRAFT_665152 [Suillus subalutaceus]KAG1866219.1 hypothetical protein F4604DRAFT_1881842 [Suillus subluteus]